MSYDFKKAVIEWSNPPFDNNGYPPSKTVSGMWPDEVKKFVSTFEKIRYEIDYIED